MSRAEGITLARGGVWFGCYGRIFDQSAGTTVLVRDADSGAVLVQPDAKTLTAITPQGKPR